MIRSVFKSTNKFATYCIIAGGPHQDLYGARIMKQIKKQDKDAHFIGIGGQLMESEGLQINYSDVKKFCHKAFFPYKNFLRWHVERSYHPVMAYIHYKNRQVNKDLDKSSFFKDIYKLKPAAFLTLGNEFFMSRLYDHLRVCYHEVDLIKPALFHLDRTHANQKHEFLGYLDHCFSTLPKKAVNYQYFNFPHTIVGQEGIGRAWQFLYQNSSKFKGLSDENSIFLSKENGQSIIKSLVQEQRAKTRQQLSLQDHQKVFFFAPGNLESEVRWSIPKLHAGFQDFKRRSEVTILDRESFTILFSVSDDNVSIASYTENLIKKFDWGCRVEIVKGAQKYPAICAADIGACLNGEIVSECAAFQLPLFVLDNMPFLQAYFTQWYQDFNNDINLATQGETFQELNSTGATTLRISDELFTFYNDPLLRDYIAEITYPKLFEMVPQINDADVLVQENVTFTKHTFTNNVIAQKLVESAFAYEAESKTIPSHKIDDVRTDMFKKVGLQ